MDELAHLELSPGTIHVTPCTKCGEDALTYDTVALKDTGETWGVHWAGTIVRCPNCAPTI